MNRALKTPLNQLEAQYAYASMTDEALMKLVQAANHDAFAELVSRHTASLLNLARRTLGSRCDADDIIQAVFIKLWQRPTLWKAGKSALSTWLYRVVLNACYDQNRAVQRRVLAEAGGDSEHVSPDVSEQVSTNQQIELREKQLRTAMLSLPPSQRDAINLAVFSGLPQKQVAEVLGVSVKAVESLLVRAKTKLKLVVAQGQTEETK